MRSRSSRFNLWAFLPWAITVLMIAGCFLIVKWMQWTFFHKTDLGSKPAGQVYHQVFLQPIPAGVSNLKIAGMASLSGVVWMRFQVADVHAFLVTMKGCPLLSLNGEGPGLSADTDPPKSEADRDHYSHAVGWDAVYKIRRPEFYSYKSIPPGHGWFGQMVVDREHRTVYVHGGLM